MVTVTNDFYSFSTDVRLMNEIFEIGTPRVPTDLGVHRLHQFHTVVMDELSEYKDCISPDGRSVDLVALADWLADLSVYVQSEAERWGIPLGVVQQIVMASQQSKLVDGKPVMAPDGSKFIKGPHFVPPEPAIEEALIAHGWRSNACAS